MVPGEGTIIAARVGMVSAIKMLELLDVKRIAKEVAREQGDLVEVVGAATTSGGTAYAEVTVVVGGCHDSDGCRIIVGADRARGEPALREALAARLREHLKQRRKTSRSAR